MPQQRIPKVECKSFQRNDVQTMGSVLVYSDEMGWFDFGPDHPFKPERATKAYELCSRYGILNHPWMKILEPETIARPLLTLFHDPDYISLLEMASGGKVRPDMTASGLGTTDEPILSGIYEWCLMAAGGTCEAMRKLVSGEILVAFNLFGGFHHAGPGHAEAFCYINDIGIAVRYALERLPDQRIAYLDFDADHGNVIQEVFYRDPRVLVISVHETGRTLCPGSGSETEIGEGEGRGFTVNVPLESGTDDEVYGYVLDAAVLPLVRSFSPDIIVSVLGTDTLISDPFTHLKLTNNSYQRVVKGITDLGPKILALGGGGYDIYRTARCWTLAWSILNHVKPIDEFAGLVGDTTFGAEIEVGSLYDYPYFSKGKIKRKAFDEAHRVIDFIHREIFPIHGI